MDYSTKYLKYKEKYINLKNNLTNKIGGVTRNKTFYIYTTGVSEWESFDKTLKFWSDVICGKICSLIPQRFNDIQILHSDILLDFNNEIKPIEEKDKISSTINQLLISDFSIDSRISQSLFTYDPLNFNEIKLNTPYIIIDFAHIFRYTGIPIQITPNESTQVYIAGHYGEQVQGNETETYNLNVIYLGYIGMEQVRDSRRNNRMISYFNFFRVNDDDTITTFFNKVLDRNRFTELKIMELHDPSEKIDNIFTRIRYKIEDEFIKNKKNLFESDFIFDDKNNQFKIVSDIMNFIMNTDMVEDDIINYISHQIIMRFLY